MQITQQASPNYNRGRQGHTPDMIVCHITEGSFAGAVSWLSNPQSRVSSHYVVARDGRVTQLVALTDTAWANGTAVSPNSNLWFGHSTLAAVRDRAVNANLYTISIEHEGRSAETNGALAPAQLTATIELIKHIRAEVQRLFGFTIPATRAHLVGHNEIVPRSSPNCPGKLYPFEEILRAVNGDTAGTLPESPSDFAREAWTWAVEHALTDGGNPSKPATREQLITILHRYHQMMAG